LRPANPGRAEEAIGFRIIAAESALLSPNMRPVVGFWLLFGKDGACGGCWCMWWRLKRSDFAKSTGEKNKRMMKG
jgi:hypothetical protein